MFRSLVFLVLLTTIPGPLAARDLVVATMLANEPFSWLEDGRPRGTDVEMVREAARRAGYGVDFVFLPWKRVLKSVEYGKVDAAVPMFRRASREVYARFGSVPLRSIPFGVFSSADTPVDYDGLEGLERRRITVVAGYAINPEFDAAWAEGRLDVTEATSIEDSLNLLLGGRVDVFVNNRESVIHRAREKGLLDAIRLAPRLLVPVEGVFVVYSRARHGPGVDALADDVDRALEEMAADGTMEWILRRYVK